MEQGYLDMLLLIIMIVSICMRGYIGQNEMNYWDLSNEEGLVIKEKKKIYVNMCLIFVYIFFSE